MGTIVNYVRRCPAIVLVYYNQIVEVQTVKINKERMKVLIACERSGVVREAFSKLGHDAWSCDILHTEIPGNHIQGDVLEILDNGWDLMIAHPPCTHLAVAGARWFKDKREEQQMAIEFFMDLANARIKKICIENPVCIMSTRYRKPDQYIHPWQFGHKRTKKTGMWLKNLPLLTPTDIVEPEYILYKSKKNKSGYSRYDKLWDPLGPNTNRAHLRYVTFQGIANAMADQWGNE